MQSYLKRILTARVYDVAIESPLEMAPNLSARIANQVLLKREDMQPVFSFKLRGAYNKMAQLTPAQLKRGVIAASILSSSMLMVSKLISTNTGMAQWWRMQVALADQE